MNNPEKDSIRTLVDTLASKDAIKRIRARNRLTAIGGPAVEIVAEALRDAHAHVRWEAAKTLTTIADPRAIPELVRILWDDDVNVRWVAGEALIAIGRDAVAPVLRELMTARENTEELYESAYHILTELAKDELRPVLTPVLHAIKRGYPEMVTPGAAQQAFDTIMKHA